MRGPRHDSEGYFQRGFSTAFTCSHCAVNICTSTVQLQIVDCDCDQSVLHWHRHQHRQAPPSAPACVFVFVFHPSFSMLYSAFHNSKSLTTMSIQHPALCIVPLCHVPLCIVHCALCIVSYCYWPVACCDSAI